MDYKKLTEDLIKAKQAAIEAAEGDDGGSANLDAMTLRVPYTRESKVVEAIKEAGLFCRGRSEWIGPYYFIQPPKCGQGDSRYRAVTAMAKAMEQAGYSVLVYHQMD